MIFTREFRENWPSFNKILFRFVFCYFIIYILLLFLSSFMEAPLRWFANNILRWGEDFEIKSTGSGDTTHQWVTLGFNAFFAIIVASLWSILDRKRDSYNQLFYWFRVVIRLLLFIMMLTYGFVKVIKTQFPDVSLLRLLQPIGDMSPMGLAWTFMGYSVGYNFFTGILEVIGGILVLFRKTKTLGAMMIIGVMLNVAMMNFMYDIPVKIFSVHIILLAAIILLTDYKRLLNFFILNKNAPAISHYSVSNDKTYQQVKLWLKLIAIVCVAGLFYYQGTVVIDQRESRKMPAPLYGIWETQQFIKNNDTIPPSLDAKERWRYLVLNSKSGSHLKLMNDSINYHKSEYSEEHKTMQFYENAEDSIPIAKFRYEIMNEEFMDFRGTWLKDTLHIKLLRKDENDFELINRGFNWVNEYPYSK